MANLGRVVLLLLLQVFVAKVVLPISLSQFSDSKTSIVLLEESEDNEQNKDLESDNISEYPDDFFELYHWNLSTQFKFFVVKKAAIPFIEQHHFIEYFQQSIKPPCHS
ncbi:MAG: hypothetical protein ACKOWW_02540 [Flavobacteriales bacterium]